MRILLTGAAGFLGSHLADRFLADGHSVIGVDNLCTGSLRNIEHLRRNRDFNLEILDICIPFDVGAVDYVYNFASPASPIHYHRLGLETLEVGCRGTRNALEIARRYGAGFLHASTSECYGDPLEHPQTETYWGNVNPVGPRSVYDEAKRFSEALVTAYHRYYHVNVHLARIFNTYGPRLARDDGRVISNLLVQALGNEPMTIYGDGQQTRSFCYVSDLVEGLVRLAATREYTPVNLGNPNEFTILSCAEIIRELVGSKSEIVFLPLPQDDPEQRRPDITKAMELLNWAPTISLKTGIKFSLDYFRATMLEGMAAR
jgi:dTDP-glucose 4,6-dehydratase